MPLQWYCFFCPRTGIFIICFEAGLMRALRISSIAVTFAIKYYKITTLTFAESTCYTTWFLGLLKFSTLLWQFSKFNQVVCCALNWCFRLDGSDPEYMIRSKFTLIIKPLCLNLICLTCFHHVCVIIFIWSWKFCNFKR